jgi:hypothetical protein
MAQYEQKTDNREFEVTNPGQSPGSWSRDQRADATEIVVRLWGRERSPALTWQTNSVLVYMIADLVGASHGRIAEESPAVLGAHFDGPRQAIVAAKRIQTSILEFLACRPGEGVGAAILIYKPRASDPAGFSADTVRQALGQAKPGQILLAENISERLSDLPGVEFRALPALTTVMGDRQTEIMELVWATPEQIALLQVSVVDESESRAADGPAASATVIVDSPFARREPTGEAMPPVAGTADFIFKDRSDGSEHGSRQAPGRASIPEDFHGSHGISLLEGLDEDRPLITRTRVIFGLVALVLGAALIAVVYRPTHVSKLPPRSLPEQTGATEAPDKGPPATPAMPEPEVKKAQAESESVQPAVKPPEVVAAKPQPPAKPLSENRAKSRKDTKETAVEPDLIEESGGLSQNDIPKLLEFAKTDTGNGKYERARLEYRKVLKLQPNNQEAKDGLKKLDRIQSDQQ